MQECARLGALGGLDGEERWDYCREVLRDLGLKIDKKDPDMKALLERLDGNPLALRVILLRLGEGRTSRELLKEIDTDFVGASEDDGTEQMQKAFRVLWSGMDSALSQVLQVIGLHEHFVDWRWIVNIIANIEQEGSDSAEE